MKQVLFNKLVFLLILLIPLNACRKSNYIVDNTKRIVDNGEGTGTITWTADNEYLLDGFVFVNDGQTLTIEPGTVIRARTGQGEHASALIVARGGKIIANGNPNKPIIFTVEGDDLDGSVPIEANGLWGGIIILGNAPLNNKSGEAAIEGIPLTEPRGIYGGTHEADNSGIIRYISIRHGGTNIGEGNEINGLTLGGVGNQTTIEFVEVVSIADDGIELFGGTVYCRYIVSAFCEDDAIDYDLGYQGKMQFCLAIQSNIMGDAIGEHDGGTVPENAKPYSMPVFSNFTCIGAGESSGNPLITFNRNGAGKYYNSIFINQEHGILIEETDYKEDSFEQLQKRNLVFEKNIFYNVAGNELDSILMVYKRETPYSWESRTVLREFFTLHGNTIQDPGIELINGTYHVLPDSVAYQNLHIITDEWYYNVDYKGAFGSVNWTRDWTLLDKHGLIQPDYW
jgi:hypothetical protein